MVGSTRGHVMTVLVLIVGAMTPQMAVANPEPMLKPASAAANQDPRQVAEGLVSQVLSDLRAGRVDKADSTLDQIDQALQRLYPNAIHVANAKGRPDVARLAYLRAQVRTARNAIAEGRPTDAAHELESLRANLAG